MRVGDPVFKQNQFLGARISERLVFVFHASPKEYAPLNG